MNQKKTNIILQTFIIFIIVLGIPSLIALHPIVYYSEAKKTNAENKLENANEYYKNVHDFLVLQKTLSKDFTENETSHMKDVRGIFNAIRILAIIFLAILIIQQVKTKKHKKRKYKELTENIKKASLKSTIILLAIILLSFLNFSAAFDAFHIIFFPQGNWVFPMDSLLITLFPETFFMNIAKKIIITTIIISASITITIYAIEKYKKKLSSNN